jgi:hypothetical protein
MTNGIERITILRQQADGRVEPSVVYKTKKATKGKSGKRADSLPCFEGFAHEAARAASTTANSYLSLHEQSNRKKQDGWLRDLPDNLWTAASRGKRKFRIWNIS